MSDKFGLSSLGSFSLGSICKDVFGISEYGISNDLSGIISSCCSLLDYNYININISHTSKEGLNSYKKDFLDCILSMVEDNNNDISQIEHFKLYNLFNDYSDNFNSAVCKIGSTTVGYEFTESTSITDSILTTGSVVTGMLGVATGSSGKKILARATAFAGGVSNLLGVGFGIAQLAGVPGFGSNSLNIEKIVNDIYENVFRVVSDMFADSWECTYDFVLDMTSDLEESILSQLHLGEIESSISNVNDWFIAICDSNFYSDDSMILNEFERTIGTTIWDDLYEVVDSFSASITNLKIQRAIIPLIQIAMNQRIIIYTRYANLVLNLTNTSSSNIRNLDVGLSFGIHSTRLFDKYEEYFSGAYFDILTNMQESSYNEIVSEINMLFDSELFCNWMYFVTLYSNFGGYPDLKWCHIDICDCDGFFNLTDLILNGVQNSSDLNDFYNKISSSFTNYFINDVFSLSPLYLNYFGNNLISNDYMSDLFLDTNVDDNNNNHFIAMKMHDYYISKTNFDWSSILSNGESAPNGNDGIDHIDECYHKSASEYEGTQYDKARYVSCGDEISDSSSNIIWYGSGNNDEFLSFVYQSNPTKRMQDVILMDMLNSDGGSCEYDTCKYSNSIYDISDSNFLLNFYVDSKNSFKCSDNSGDVIGARYMTRFTNSTFKIANVLGIEILCRDGDLEDTYYDGKNYNLFNFDNRNVLIGFNPSNIGEYSWSPWFICPKQHKLEISFGSVKECLTCMVKRFPDSDPTETLEGYYKSDIALMYDYYINYRCVKQ